MIGTSHNASSQEYKGKNRKLKVQVWIYCRAPDREWRFLILKTRPERGGFWQPVTGSVEVGETLEEAALREAQEETGLVFQDNPRSIGGHFEFESRGQKVRETAYSLSIVMAGQKFPHVKIDPHEHVDYEWVTSKQAISRIGYPSNAQMLHSLLGQLKY